MFKLLYGEMETGYTYPLHVRNLTPKKPNMINKIAKGMALACYGNIPNEGTMDTAYYGCSFAVVVVDVVVVISTVVIDFLMLRLYLLI